MLSRKRMHTLERQLDRIETALIVRDPGTSISADAYEGLRKQVVAAAQARMAHLAQLAELDLALRRGASLDSLRNLSAQWLKQAGVEVVEDPANPRLFETAAAPGEPAEVELPAYVDAVTNRIIHQGRLRKAKSGQHTPPARGEAEPETSASAGDGSDAS